MKSATQPNLKPNMPVLNNTSKNNITTTPFNTITKQPSTPFKIPKAVEESIVMSLLSLADAINKKGDLYCQTYGITMQQYLIMLYLAGDPNIEYIEENRTSRPIVASELADALNVSRPNITNVINLLIVKNMVEQVREKTDWRKKSLILTKEGWILLEKMQSHRHRINRRLLSHLSENEKTCFLESLRTCLDLLNNKNCS